MARLAAHMGFQAHDVHSPNMTKEEEYLLRRGLGTGLTYNNFMDGQRDGYLVEIYDQTQSQILSGATIISHTVIEISRDGLATPEFILQPESRLSWSSHLVEGSTGLKFGDDVTFSVHNYIRGPDHDAIHSLFSAQARDLLRDNERLWIQGTGFSYRFYHASRKIPVRELPTVLDKALELTHAFEAAVQQSS